MTSNTHFNNFDALESWCTPRFLHPVVVVEASSAVDLSALKNGLTFIQLLRPFSTCQGPILSRVDERKKQAIMTTYPFGARLVRSDCVHGLGDHLVAVSEEHLRHLLVRTSSVLSTTSSPDYGLLLDVLLQKTLLQTPSNEGRTARCPRLFQKDHEEGVKDGSTGLPLQLQHLQELYLSSSSWRGKMSEECSGAPRQRPQYVSLKPTFIQSSNEEAPCVRARSDSLRSTDSAGRSVPFTAGRASEKVHGRIVSIEVVPSASSTGSNARLVKEHDASSTLNRAKNTLPSRSTSPSSSSPGENASLAPKSASEWSELDILMQGTVPSWYPSFLHDFFSLIRCGPMDTLDHPVGIIYAVSTREGLTSMACKGEGVTPANWKSVVLREIRKELVRQYNLVQQRVWPAEYASIMSTEVHSYFFLVHDDDHFSGVEMHDAECPPLFPLSTDDVGDLLMECQAITSSMGIFGEMVSPADTTSRPSTTTGSNTTPSAGPDSLTSKTIRCNSWMVVTLNSASLPLRPPSASVGNADTRSGKISASSSSSTSGAASSRSSSDGVDPLLWVQANPPSVDILCEEGLQHVAALSGSASYAHGMRTKRKTSPGTSVDGTTPQVKLSFVTPRSSEIDHVGRVWMGCKRKGSNGGRPKEDGVRVQAIPMQRRSSSVESFTIKAPQKKSKPSSCAITARLSPSLYSTYCIPFPWTRKGVREICGTWCISPPSDPSPKGTTSLIVPSSTQEYPMYTGCFLSHENITDLQSIMTAYLAHHLAQFIQRHIAGLSAAIRLRRTTTLGKVTAWFRSENAKPKLELVASTCRQRHFGRSGNERPGHSRPEGKRVPQEEVPQEGTEVLRFSATSIEMQMRRCADCALFLQDFDYAETNYKLCCDELLETARTNKELVQPLLGAVQEGMSLCQLFKKQVPHVLPSLPAPYLPSSVSPSASTPSPSDAIIPATDSLTNHKCSGGVCRLDVSLADYYHAFLSGQEELYPYIMRSSLLAFEMCRTHQHPSPAMDRAAAVLLRLLSTEIPKQRSHLWSAVIQQLLAGTYLCMNPPKPMIQKDAFAEFARSQTNDDATSLYGVRSPTTVSACPSSPSQRTFPVLSHLRRFVYHLHKAGSRWFIDAAIDPASAQAALYCYRRLFICCKALVHQEEVGLFGNEANDADGGTGTDTAALVPPRSHRFLNCGLGNDALRLLAQTQRSGWRAMLDDITGKLIFLLSLSAPHAFYDGKEAPTASTTPLPPADTAVSADTVALSPETETRALRRTWSRWERQVLDAEALAVVAYAISRNIRCHLDYTRKDSVWNDVRLLFDLQRRCDLSQQYVWWCLQASSPHSWSLPLVGYHHNDEEEEEKRKCTGKREQREEEEKEHTRHVEFSPLSRPPTPSTCMASGYMMLPIVDPHSLVMDVNYYKMDVESQSATQKAKECFGDLLDKEWELTEEALHDHFQRLLQRKWNNTGTVEKNKKDSSATMPSPLTSLPLFSSSGTSLGDEPRLATPPSPPLLSSPPSCVPSPFVFPPYVGDASCMKVSIPDAKARVARGVQQQQLAQDQAHHHGRMNSSSSSCSLTFGSLNSPLHRSAMEGSATSFASHDTAWAVGGMGEKDRGHLIPPSSSALVSGTASPDVLFSSSSSSLPSPLLFTVPQEQCIWLSVSMMNPLEVPLVVRELALVYLIEGEDEQAETEAENRAHRAASNRAGEGGDEAMSDGVPFSHHGSVPQGEKWPFHVSLPVRGDGGTPSQTSASPSRPTTPPAAMHYHPSSATELEWNPFEKKRVRLPFYTASLPTVPIQLIGLSWSLCVPPMPTMSAAASTGTTRLVYEGRYYFATALQAGVPPVLLSPFPSRSRFAQSARRTSSPPPPPPPPSEKKTPSTDVAKSVPPCDGTVLGPLPFPSSAASPPPPPPAHAASSAPILSSRPSSTTTSSPPASFPGLPTAQEEAPPSRGTTTTSAVPIGVPWSSLVPRDGPSSNAMATSLHPSPLTNPRPRASPLPLSLLQAPENIRFGITPARASLTATFVPPLPLQMYDGEVFHTSLRITNHAKKRSPQALCHASSPLDSRSTLPSVGPYAWQVTIQPSPHNAYVLCFPQRVGPSSSSSSASLPRSARSMASRRRGERQITFTEKEEEEEDAHGKGVANALGGTPPHGDREDRVWGGGFGRRDSADAARSKTRAHDACGVVEVADCIGPEEAVEVPVVLRARYHSVALAASSLVTSPSLSSPTASPLSNDVLLLIGYRSASVPRTKENTPPPPSSHVQEEATASLSSPPQQRPEYDANTASVPSPISQAYFFRSQPTGRGLKKHRPPVPGSTSCFPLIPIHAVVLHRVHRRIRVEPLLSIYASVLPPLWNGVRPPPSSFASPFDSPMDTSLFSPVVSLAVKNTMQVGSTRSSVSSSSSSTEGPSHFSTPSSRFPTASVTHRKGMEGTLFITSVVASHGPEWKVSSLTHRANGPAGRGGDATTTPPALSFAAALSNKERSTETEERNAFPISIPCRGAHALLFQLARQRVMPDPFGAAVPPHTTASCGDAKKEMEKKMDQKTVMEEEEEEEERYPIVSTPTPSEDSSQWSPVAHPLTHVREKSFSHLSTDVSQHSRSATLEDGKSEGTGVEGTRDENEGEGIASEFPYAILEDQFSSFPKGPPHGKEKANGTDAHQWCHGFDPIVDEPASTRHFLLFSSVMDVGRMAADESEMGSASYSPFAARGPARGMGAGLSFYKDGGSTSSANTPHTLSKAKKEAMSPEKATRRKENRRHPSMPSKPHESEKGGGRRLHASGDPSAWQMHRPPRGKEDTSEAALYGRRLERYAPMVFTVYWAIKEKRSRRADDHAEKKEEKKEEEAFQSTRPQGRIRRGRLYFWIHPLSFLSFLHPSTSSRFLPWRQSSVVEGSCTGSVAPSPLPVMGQGSLLPLGMDEEDSWQVLAARRHQQRWLCRAMQQEIPFSAYLSLGSRSGYWGAMVYGLSFPARDASSSAADATHGGATPIFSIYSPYFRALVTNDAFESLDLAIGRGKEGVPTAHDADDKDVPMRVGVIPASIGLSSFSPLPLLVDVCATIASARMDYRCVPSSLSLPVEASVYAPSLSEETPCEKKRKKSDAAPLGGKEKSHGTYWIHRIMGARAADEKGKEEEKATTTTESVMWRGSSGTEKIRVCHSSLVASVVVLPGESARISVELVVLSEKIVKRTRSGSQRKWRRGGEVEYSRGEKEMEGQCLTAVNPNIFYLTVRPLVFPSSPDRLFSGMTRSALLESFPLLRDVEEEDEEEESPSLKAMRGADEEPSSSSMVSSYSLAGKKKIMENNGSSSAMRRMTLSSSGKDPFSSTARFVDDLPEDKSNVSPAVAPTLPRSASPLLEKRTSSSMRSDSNRVCSVTGSGNNCSLFDRISLDSFSPSQFFILNANPCSTIFLNSFKEEEEKKRDEEEDEKKIRTEKLGCSTGDPYFSPEGRYRITQSFSSDLAALFASTEDCCREVINILDESPRNSSLDHFPGPFSRTVSSSLASYRAPLQTENEQLSFFGALHELSELLYV